MVSKVTTRKTPIPASSHLSQPETPIAVSIASHRREVNRQITDVPPPSQPLESNKLSVLSPIEQSIVSFRHSFNKPHELTSDGMPDAGEIAEGPLPFVDAEKHLKNLDAYFGSENVPESERPALVQKLKILIAQVTRPKWVGRLERGGELAILSAPSFLKRVHADYIGEDGTVENEVIRAIDPELMRAVESYISKRKKNNADLGDAEGLDFVLTRPGKEEAKKPHRASEISP